MRSQASLLGRLPEAPLRDHADGEPGLHYLCTGYEKFFKHIRNYMRAMTTLVENDLPVSLVMKAVEGPLIVTRDTITPKS